MKHPARNPLDGYEESSLRRLFNGSRKKLNKETVQIICKSIDRESFSNHFSIYSLEQLNALCNKLKEHGYDASTKKEKDNYVGKVCADIFVDIIIAMNDLPPKKRRKSNNTEKEISQVSSNDYIIEESERDFEDDLLNDLEKRYNFKFVHNYYYNDENDLYPKCHSCLFWIKIEKPTSSIFKYYRDYDDGFCLLLLEEKPDCAETCSGFRLKNYNTTSS